MEFTKMRGGFDIKTLSHLMRASPLPFFVGGWILGQALYSYVSSRTALFVAVVAVVCLIGAFGRLGAALGSAFISGCLSISPVGETVRDFNVGAFQGLAEVAGTVRYPKPGKITVPVIIQGLGVSSANSSSLIGSLLNCSTRDLPWRNGSSLLNGDVVAVRGEVRKLQDDQGQGPVGYSAYLKRRGIEGECTLTHVSTPFVAYRTHMQNLRLTITDHLESVVGSGERSGVLLAMLLGKNDTLSNELVQSLSQVSLSHVLIVSGYQVTLWHTWLWFLVELSFRSSGSRALSVGRLFTLIAVWAYVLLVGTEPSCVRAGVALTISELSVLGERKLGDWQSISLALLAVTLLWPGCFFEMGTQLTFVALITLRFAGRASFGVEQEWLRTFFASVLTTTVSSLVILSWAKEINPVGIFLNPLVVPVLSVLGGPIAMLGYLGWLLEIDPGGRLLQFTADRLLVILYWAADPTSKVFDPNSGISNVFMARYVAIVVMSVVLSFLLRSTWRRVTITGGLRLRSPRM